MDPSPSGGLIVFHELSQSLVLFGERFNSRRLLLKDLFIKFNNAYGARKLLRQGRCRQGACGGLSLHGRHSKKASYQYIRPFVLPGCVHLAPNRDASFKSPPEGLRSLVRLVCQSLELEIHVEPREEQ